MLSKAVDDVERLSMSNLFSNFIPQVFWIIYKRVPLLGCPHDKSGSKTLLTEYRYEAALPRKGDVTGRYMVEWRW